MWRSELINEFGGNQQDDYGAKVQSVHSKNETNTRTKAWNSSGQFFSDFYYGHKKCRIEIRHGSDYSMMIGELVT
jgi:hypothetical protein